MEGFCAVISQTPTNFQLDFPPGNMLLFKTPCPSAVTPSNLPWDDFNYYMDPFRTTPQCYIGNYCFISPNGFQSTAHLLSFPFQIKTSVIWATPNVSFSIPLWVIILAILLGLLVLAILTLALWKVSFFLFFFLLSGEAAEEI